MSQNNISKVGVTAEPKYLRKISSFDNISTMLYGISNYVSNSLPDSLSRTKKDQTQQHNEISRSSSKSNIVAKKKPILCASFDWIWGVFSTGVSRKKSSRKLQRRLCLLLGYEDGFQIWDIMDADNIKEIFSYRQTNQRVTCLKALPEPKLRENVIDKFKGYRTLIAIVSESPNDEHRTLQPSSRLDFFSLKTHSNIKTIEYEFEKLVDIRCNDNAIVLSLKPNRLLILSPYTLTSFSALDNVISNPVTDAPVAALGDRLLAYATSSRAPTSTHDNRSKEFVDQIYKAEKVAKNVVHGVRTIGDLGYRTLSNYFSDSPPLNNLRMFRNDSQSSELDEVSSVASDDPSKSNNLPSGMVIVKDIGCLKYTSKSTNRTAEEQLNKSVQHFKAHNHRIAAMSFNRNGNLLVTASIQGTSFKVFEVNNNDVVNNIYKLSRGYTFANVEDISFSVDSKWLAVSTERGTTHVFAINPYGGHTNVQSHIHTYIANERSRYNRRSITDKAVSLTSVARLKHKGLVVENEENSSESRSISSNDDDKLSYSGKLAPQAMFIANSHGLPKSSHRRGSSAGPQGWQQMFTFSTNGILTLHQFRTRSISVKKKMKGRIHNSLELEVSTEDIAEWNLVRGHDWAQVHDTVDAPTLSQNEGHQPLSRWILQSEISTHPTHISPLWLCPQFDFEIYDLNCSEYNESFFSLPPTRRLEFRKENPLPYGVYQPRRTDGDSSLSEEDLEDHLSNAMRSKLEIRPGITDTQPIPIYSHESTVPEEVYFDEALYVDVNASIQSSATLVSEGRNLAYESDSDSDPMYPVFRYKNDE
ncbi:hypothetical protein K7432_000172 [Basidiobolus ranarum]|uniref:BCAS3 WD40 domain-containing protein n=1 Tax=Basidiobolus ranarum TaxID=34480 RepID=A0ABR2X4X5_9FUNG